VVHRRADGGGRGPAPLRAGRLRRPRPRGAGGRRGRSPALAAARPRHRRHRLARARQRAAVPRARALPRARGEPGRGVLGGRPHDPRLHLPLGAGRRAARGRPPRDLGRPHPPRGPRGGPRGAPRRRRRRGRPQPRVPLARHGGPGGVAARPHPRRPRPAWRDDPPRPHGRYHRAEAGRGGPPSQRADLPGGLPPGAGGGAAAPGPRRDEEHVPRGRLARPAHAAHLDPRLGPHPRTGVALGGRRRRPGPADRLQRAQARAAALGPARSRPAPARDRLAPAPAHRPLRARPPDGARRRGARRQARRGRRARAPRRGHRHREGRADRGEPARERLASHPARGPHLDLGAAARAGGAHRGRGRRAGDPPGAPRGRLRALPAGARTRAPHPGVGVGLTLVARFAELHGGRAWVEDRPGGGASFRVYLPEA